MDLPINFSVMSVRLGHIHPKTSGRGNRADLVIKINTAGQQEARQHVLFVFDFSPVLDLQTDRSVGLLSGRLLLEDRR